MALVYKRSTKNAARRYERSSGMEPNLRRLRSNPGVNALTVVNSGKPPKRGPDGRFVKANPFQWISGRKRHIHASPPYRTIAGAKGWMARHPDAIKGRGRARLYATDEFGTVLTKAIPQRLLKNSTRRSGMAYNIGALRRAMRANYRGSSEMQSVLAAARGMDTGHKPRRRSSRPIESASEGGMTIASAGTKRRGKRSSKRGSKKASKQASKRTTLKRASKRASKRGSKRASKRGSKRASKRGSKRASKRGSKRASKRGSKRSTAAKKAARTRASRRGGRRRASRRSSGRRVSRRGSKRRASRFFHGRKVRLTGREYIDKYLSRGLMPTITRVGRLPLSRSGRPSIMTYPIPSTVGRLSKRSSVRGGSRRGYAVGATYRGRRKKKMTPLAANRRRRSRRNSRRRMSRNVMYATANRRRSSRRRHSRRRMSRNQKYVVMNRRRGSRRRMTRNMLAVSKLKYRGTGSHRVGSPKGRYYQLVEYGPKSGKFRHAGYPVLVPPHVSQYGYVRKFRFGGAAKDAHARAKARGYAERKRYSRWRKPPASWLKKKSRKKKMAANRRSSRRSSMRKNQKYVVMNRRRHGRRVRRNTGMAGMLGGADLMRDVVTPVIGGTVGFVAARLLSNGLANVAPLRNALDSGAADAAGAANTKIAANLLGIAATLGLSTQVDIIRQNRGALVTGMGLALTDRLIQRFSAGSTYASYLGEYVDQPMGEYVDQPMSGLGTMYATAGVGEYVDQPMSGLGTMYATAGVGEYVDQSMSGLGTMYAAAGYAEGVDPADQAGVDGLMDVMEAAAGVQEAAAGMGATMGSGEADAQLAAMYAKHQPPSVSIQNPVTPALPVTGELPFEKDITASLVTPEGKGFAGGVFARHLFAGMF